MWCTCKDLIVNKYKYTTLREPTTALSGGFTDVCAMFFSCYESFKMTRALRYLTRRTRTAKGLRGHLGDLR